MLTVSFLEVGIVGILYPDIFNILLAFLKEAFATFKIEGKKPPRSYINEKPNFICQ